MLKLIAMGKPHELHPFIFDLTSQPQYRVRLESMSPVVVPGRNHKKPACKCRFPLPRLRKLRFRSFFTPGTTRKLKFISPMVLPSSSVTPSPISVAKRQMYLDRKKPHKDGKWGKRSQSKSNCSTIKTIW